MFLVEILIFIQCLDLTYVFVIACECARVRRYLCMYIFMYMYE